MKKFLKVICAAVLICAAAAGGYIAGQRVQLSSITSALPKKTIEKTDLPSADAEENSDLPSEISEENKEVPPEKDTREIKVSQVSSADSSWTVVDHAYNAAGLGTLTLYTSAQKADGEIIWDDGQKWIVEITDGNGGYFTLYDQYVSNGSVYYDVVQKENGVSVINVYTFTGSGTTIKQYTPTEEGFSEKVIYDSGTVNRLYSTVPSYR